jgi:hypothetical protein
MLTVTENLQRIPVSTDMFYGAFSVTGTLVSQFSPSLYLVYGTSEQALKERS